ncbi:MAG TPA: metal-dependent hydrolase [Vicinamibacterales bacterium]|nr:metal-dependent hydrolase [Vicinamibacterales bacterium]
MDNVCHTLVGVAVARAGLHQKTALATATAAIAANLPDVDVLVFATGMPSVAFRRGITHGVPAQLLLPIALAGLVWLIAGRRARFGWLLVLSYIGVLTHVFLDFLNTYGVRLLSPWSQRWFYGDAVFIVDVWLWLILGAGVVLARGPRPRYAAAALAVATLYVTGMLLSARMARAIVLDAWVGRTGEAPRALMVGPVPVTPFRRTIIVDTGDRYFLGSFRWFPARVAFEEHATLKNDWLPEVAAARQDPAVRGILVWSRFPVWETRGVPGGVLVRLRDMRFRGIDRGGFTATTVVPR